MGAQFPEEVSEAARQAVQATFTSICGTEPLERSEVELPLACPGLVSVVSFVGEVVWWLALVLPGATAQALARKFTGSAIPYNSSLMDDVIRELANVLGGDVVARLDAHRIRARMSLPQVTRGGDVEELLPKIGDPSRQLYYTTPQGNFWARIAVVPAGQQPGRMPGT